jgi:energy-coupling factor transporter ATP-binding protein EcfA2
LGGPYATPLGLPLEPGHPIGIVGPHGSGRSTALAHLRRRLEAAGQAVHFTGADGGNWSEVLAALAQGAVALVDDIETVAGAVPLSLPPTGTLIAACTTATAASCRPPTALLQANPRGVVLWAAGSGAAAAFGPGRGPAAGVELAAPRLPEPPGRGRLIVAGRSHAVQLAA